MKFKLDENLSPSLATLFSSAGHEAHSIVQQGLGGAADDSVIDRCQKESRVLVSFDLDFANIRAYPPNQYAGIVVLRLATQANAAAIAAVSRVLKLLQTEELTSTLWIVEETRIRIHE